MKFTLNNERIQSRNDGGFCIDYRPGGKESKKIVQWKHEGLITNIMSVEVPVPLPQPKPNILT
jgi:hypothetical protein